MRVKSEARRQAIVDAAANLFGKLGFEQVSMSAIAEQVGGSKKTLYSYFPSKEELFLEVMYQSANRHMQDIHAVMDPDKDMRVVLQHFGERLLSVLCTTRMVAMLRVVYSVAGRFEVSHQFYERGPLAGVQLIADYLEDCHARGYVACASPTVAAQHFMALLKAEVMEPLLAGACQPTELPALSPVVERAVTVFLRAYSVYPANTAACRLGKP